MKTTKWKDDNTIEIRIVIISMVILLYTWSFIGVVNLEIFIIIILYDGSCDKNALSSLPLVKLFNFLNKKEEEEIKLSKVEK